MALSMLSRLQISALKTIFTRNGTILRTPNVNAVRTHVYSDSGAILPKPERVPLGLPKVLLVVGVSVFVGGTISKNGAEFLEEHELFIPDEDDD